MASPGGGSAAPASASRCVRGRRRFPRAAGRRRWGRYDHDAIAAAQAKVDIGEQRLQQALTAESDLRDRVAAIASHQRQRVITDSAPRGQELAAGRGVSLVAAVRDSDAEEARRLGATMVVNTADELEAAVHREWPDGVDACIDTVALGASALGCVRNGGRFVTSVPTSAPEATRDIAPQTVQAQFDAAAAIELACRFAAGELTVRIAEVLPLERFRDAYTRLSRGGLQGEIVLTPNPRQRRERRRQDIRTQLAKNESAPSGPPVQSASS